MVVYSTISSCIQRTTKPLLHICVGCVWHESVSVMSVSTKASIFLYVPLCCCSCVLYVCQYKSVWRLRVHRWANEKKMRVLFAVHCAIPSLHKTNTMKLSRIFRCLRLDILFILLSCLLCVCMCVWHSCSTKSIFYRSQNRKKPKWHYSLIAQFPDSFNANLYISVSLSRTCCRHIHSLRLSLIHATTTLLFVIHVKVEKKSLRRTKWINNSKKWRRQRPQRWANKKKSINK